MKDFFEKQKLNLNSYEKKLIRKFLNGQKLIEIASIKLEPHRITFYLYELATIFTLIGALEMRRMNLNFIQNGKIKSETTLIIKLVSIVVKWNEYS